jgi:hypothetical protein
MDRRGLFAAAPKFMYKICGKKEEGGLIPLAF